ncbi:hypothetical protein [Nitratireductor luteus]|uniref:hypothetical protein n=1 Tax=Nitratireductor luteus TaxID=2976980 RepID=UPI0022406795|nr:hypothetical protein [Nitratireductor luteus]
MAEKRSGMPLSGEIVASDEPSVPAGEPQSPDTDRNILDAEFETLPAGPEHRPEWLCEPGLARTSQADTRGLESLRPDTKKPVSARRSPAGPAFWVMGLCIVAGSFWISGGHSLFREAVAPMLSGQAAGLKVAALESRVEMSGANPLLLIDGRAVNESSEARALPDLLIGVIDHEGRTTHYKLGTNGHRLEPGHSYPFSSRFVVPKDGVKSVSVSFQE